MSSFSNAREREVVLAADKKSDYYILSPENPTLSESEAALVLQKYFLEVTKVKLPISSKEILGKPFLSVGKTNYASNLTQNESFVIKSRGNHIIFSGDHKKSILFGVYHFIEHYLNCRKWAPNEKAECPKILDLRIKLPLSVNENPSFLYREVYSTAELDPEYMDWYKLNRLDDLWGLWGHTYNKLVAPQLFKSHPEYFSFFDGKRRPNQLCLSNKEVLKISMEVLERNFQDQPYAKYWSISPNDDIGYCECDLCQRVNQEEGGPQGSLIRFINIIADQYPDKIFTTLAYGATVHAPLKTKPKANVYVFLSNIDVYRNNPISIEKSANSFRNILQNWKLKTPNIFIWDYNTEFTNYLAPFPDTFNIAENIEFYNHNEVKGIFAQMGGSNYVYQNELKTFLLAKKLWNSVQSEKELITNFLIGYYGKAAPVIQKYMFKIDSAVRNSERKLDIYGNPVNEFDSYLSPQLMDEFSNLFDEAEKLADNNKILKRVQRLRLSFDYTHLQQTRFYGIENHGIFTEDSTGQFEIKKDIPLRVKRFIRKAAENGVQDLTEDGLTLQDYNNEWQNVFKNGLKKNLATGSKVIFENPWIPEYPAKKTRTLTDGMYGFEDFSYNWLIFEKNMEVILDLSENKMVKSISTSFLENQRHWIFLPQSVSVLVSSDGISYETLQNLEPFVTFENNLISTHKKVFLVGKKIRFIKVIATPLKSLPDWKTNNNKRPLIASDEIWVE